MRYLDPVRREAAIKAAAVRKAAQEEKTRRLEQLRDRLIDSWTRGSSRRDSVLLKIAFVRRLISTWEFALVGKGRAAA